MTSVNQHALSDCFTLRARIGWQGLRSDEFKEFGPYLVTGTDFGHGKVDWDTCYHVSQERFEQDKGIQLREQDLLVTKDGTVGKTAFVVDCPQQATLNSHIFLIRSKDGSVEPAFLYYLLNSHVFSDFMRNTLTGTTIKGLTQGNFYKFSFDAPDVPTQKHIVKVLQAIDNVIECSRAYIKKYSEIKSGMLYDLFEKGLKDCKSIPLGKIAKIQRGGSPRPIEEYITDREDGVNWIKIGDTSPISKYITSAKEKIIPSGVRHSRKVKPGDFVLSNSMSFGRPYILKIDGCVHDGWLVISDYEQQLDVNYLYYVLCTHQVQKQLISLAAGSTVQNLKSDTVKKVIIPVLESITEQRRLACILEQIDNKLDNERMYLQKMEEAKKGLIHDMIEQSTRDWSDKYAG